MVEEIRPFGEVTESTVLPVFPGQKNKRANHVKLLSF
jgi:hypothetical protein